MTDSYFYIFIQVIGWVGTIFVLYGYYLNANKHILSWLVWIVANFLLFIYSIYMHVYPQVGLAFVLMVLNIYGYFNWKRNGEGT